MNIYEYVTDAMMKRSVANEGNTEQLEKLFARAAAGESLTICFLGGSITQGSLSSTPKTCYTYLVYKWFTERFPQASFRYVNAGIGGTTSQFGIARLAENVTPAHPDFCMIEFSVNDAPNAYYREAYEGLVRRIAAISSRPAMIIMNNLFYDTGACAQTEHNEIGAAYGIPCISIRDAVRPEIESGRIARTLISPDGLHPNDAGHGILAELVIGYLERIAMKCGQSGVIPAEQAACAQPGRTSCEQPEVGASAGRDGVPLKPITVNALEHLHRTQNRSTSVVCKGFKADLAEKKGIWDIFRHGWTASKKGDSIRFEFTGSELAVQYRKTIVRPAPVAIAVIDGDEAHSVVLDANFEEDWGDHLCADTLMYHGCLIDPKLVHRGRESAVPGPATAAGQDPVSSVTAAATESELDRLSQLRPVRSRHTVEIRITETHPDDRTPFCLVSFMTA